MNPLPSNPELEYAVAIKQDNHALSVYADWLISQNHPMGEIIALEMVPDERKDAKQKQELSRLREQYYTFISQEISNRLNIDGLPEERIHLHDTSEVIDIKWKCGFITDLKLCMEVYSPEVITEVFRQVLALLQTPFAYFLDSLHIALNIDPEDNPMNYTNEHLAPLIKLFDGVKKNGAGKYLTNLKLLASTRFPGTRKLNLTAFLSSFPHLQKLDLHGEFSPPGWVNSALRELIIVPYTRHSLWVENFSAPEIPELRKLDYSVNYVNVKKWRRNINFLINNPRLRKLQYLSLSLNGVNHIAMDVFQEFDFPELEDLILEIYTPLKENPANTPWQSFSPFFTRASLPALQNLDFLMDEYVPEFVKELSRATFLPGLKRLSICTYSDGLETARLLLKHQDSFRHIKEFNLKLYISNKKLMKKLEKAFSSSKIIFE